MKKTVSLRILALLCSLFMLVAAASGCGKDTGDGSSADDNPVSGGVTDTAESVKTALKYDANESLDLGKKTLSVSVWGGVVEEGADEYFDRRYELERRTEERYNVNIEWVPTNTANFIQDVTLAFTSGKKFADLIFAPSYYGFDLCRVGAVIPLDDYIDYSSPFYSLTADNLLYVDGKHYSYMPDELSVNSVGYYVTYNQTLLEKAGCEDPMKLYEEGKWDWDAFKKIIEQTTIIESGETVQYGVGGSNLLDALCLSNGFSLITMDTKNNKFECGLYSDEGLTVLNFMRDIGYTLHATDGNYGGHNSQITFGDAKTAMLICPSYYAGRFVSSGMPVGSVPMPKGPDADGYVNGLEMQEWWMVSAVSDFETKDLIQVALDMNDNDPAYEDTYFSAEGKMDNFLTRVYEGNMFATEEESEFFYDYITSDDVETILNIANTDIGSTLAANIYYPICEGQDPRSVLEKVKPVINTALENMLPDKLK